MVARPDSAGVWKARATTASMAMFTRPASPSAAPTNSAMSVAIAIGIARAS
jgi:hypothetical protein